MREQTSRGKKEQIRAVEESARMINRSGYRIGLVLGSGLGDFGDRLTHATVIETGKIPHYPVSTVEGHKGRLLFGKLKGVKLCILQGRVHFYEMGDLQSVLYPILVLRKLGIRSLILTNAAGGINGGFSPGDLMLITDQMNLTFENPVKVRCMELYDRK